MGKLGEAARPLSEATNSRKRFPIELPGFLLGLLDAVSVAFRNLRRSPVRTTLTSLGVIVGAASIVTTFSIGNGARKNVERVLASPETRTVYLSAFNAKSGANRQAQNTSLFDRLRSDDYLAVRHHALEISAATPRITLGATSVSANGQTIDAVLEGLDREGFAMAARQFVQGTSFGNVDVDRGASVCVISESLSSSLYKELPRGDGTLRVGNTALRIVGVVDDSTVDPASVLNGRDLRVYVPYTTLLRRMARNPSLTIEVQARDLASIRSVESGLVQAVEQRRGLRKAEFRTFNSFNLYKAASESSLTMRRLLAAIGGISLIVGGIGIMNIMLVSVRERTYEIGIRLAVGTRRRLILSQFLAEAVLLSAIGGAIGATAGVGLSSLFTRVNNWPTAVTTGSVVGAFLCSLAVGLFFGLYPASRASQLAPVEALRAEH